MIDILVLTLPVDRERAEAILDTLHESKIAGPYRTRFHAVHPLDAGWREVERVAEVCPCVIFCWSYATQSAEAMPLVALGQRVLAADHAISVELDRTTLPAEMAKSTCYPLFGWRSHLTRSGRFLVGNNALKEIAVAAARKASGQDPPPPQAFWGIIRAQAWTAMVGILAVLGTISTLWGFYNDQHIAKMLDREGKSQIATMADQRDCKAVRAYLATQNESPWADEAERLRSRCHLINKIETRAEEQPLPVFGMTKDEALIDAKGKCEGYAKNVGGRLTSFSLDHFKAGADAVARCKMSVPTVLEVEVMD